MRSVRISAVLTLVLASAAAAQTGSAVARAAAASITAETVKQRLAVIASDSLRGRDTPSPGLEMAAKYVADNFASFGLKPAGDSGTFIQRWPYQAQHLDATGVKATIHGVADKTLAYGSDYFVAASPNTDTLIGPVMKATGDAANAAYAGKIVAFPVAGTDLNADWGNAAKSAIVTAMTSGAKGVVLVLDPGFTAETVSSAVGALADQMVPIPVFGIRNALATEWLNAPAPTLNLHTRIAGVNGNPPNTVGILEGSDPVLKNTYIVFSAHMDHLGVGAPNAQGDSIYNGADDDGSGTTAVIEVARAFSSMKERPKRSLIFLTVSGEEKGLFGSKFFTEHPPVPADKIVADINIDMIGRNNPDTTVAIGQEYTSLGAETQSVVKAHPELHLIVAPDLWPSESLFTRSDHFNFAMKKIPAIFFTSGLHKDYHQPSDEPKTIDNDKLARTARLVFWLGNDIANSTTAPTWTPAGLKVIENGGE